MTATLHDQLAAESAEMEKRIRAAERKAEKAEQLANSIQAEAKEERTMLVRARQRDAKETLEGVITVVRAAASLYITQSDNPERARQMLQNFLSKQLHPTVGPIPDSPWGSGTLE